MSKVNQGPSIFVASNDAQAIAYVNAESGNSFTTINEALDWVNTQEDYLVQNRDYEGIVTDGLILNLDAGFTPSYPRSGTTWYDVSSGGNNGTLINGPTFNSDNGGSIVFDGIDDSVDTPSLIGTNLEFLSNPSINSNILSWSIWSFNESATSYYLMSTGSQTSSTGMAISYQSGSPFISYQSNTKAMSVNPGVANWPLNEWIQWAFTSNGTNWVVYRNGLLHNSGTLIDSGRGDTQTILRLGGPNNSTCCRFNGKISTTQVYTKALTASEVLQNFNAQKDRFGL